MTAGEYVLHSEECTAVIRETDQPACTADCRSLDTAAAEIVDRARASTTVRRERRPR